MPLDRDEIVIDGEPFRLREQGGRRMWEVEPVPSQPGDAIANPHLLTHHGGFGASHRHTQFNGQPTDPTHHDFAENVNTTLSTLLAPAPRVTYFGATHLVSLKRMFRIGGFTNSVIGGEGVGDEPGAIGGISGLITPQKIIEYGNYLYALCGTYTITIDPNRAEPQAVEAKFHGNTAQARSGDRFNDRLVVALGSAVDAAIATAPFSLVTGQSTWTEASGVQMDVFARGSAGRLFAAQGHLAFNVLPGLDPASLANYTPSAGEKITDPSDPVRSLTEFASALVAGTARSARTIDPDRNYQSVALVPESRLSASDFDGRGAIAVGPEFFHATSRGVNILTTMYPPQPVGPELLVNNASDFRGGEPGVPDFLGDWVAWPYYFPDVGHSMIYLMRRRAEGRPGTGRYEWHDFIYLPNRECRTVRFWGGSTTRGPRLFFGASTPSSALQFGWVDMGHSMVDMFVDARPATSGRLLYPADDFGQPGVTHEVERIEMPWVEGADANNYWVWSVAPDLDSDYVDLVISQDATNGERVTSNGYQVVYAPDDDIPAGKLPKFRLRFVQSAAATEFLKIRGNPVAYIAARPAVVNQVRAQLDVEGGTRRDAEEQVEWLMQRYAKKVELEVPHDLGDGRWIRIIGAEVVEEEIRDANGEARYGVRATWREVAS